MARSIWSGTISFEQTRNSGTGRSRSEPEPSERHRSASAPMVMCRRTSSLPMTATTALGSGLTPDCRAPRSLDAGRASTRRCPLGEGVRGRRVRRGAVDPGPGPHRPVRGPEDSFELPLLAGSLRVRGLADRRHVRRSGELGTNPTDPDHRSVRWERQRPGCALCERLLDRATRSRPADVVDQARSTRCSNPRSSRQHRVRSADAARPPTNTNSRSSAMSSRPTGRARTPPSAPRTRARPLRMR